MGELCNKTPIVCIVGPTASGKTGLSISLAKEFDAEVISCDSMQLYKHMNIGTAKPTKEEMDGVVHHLIDIIEPSQEFSLAQYVTLAKEKIQEITARNKRVILVGGTGLYYSSLIDNVSLSPIESDKELRDEIEREYDEKGASEMLFRLKEFDPVLAEKLHENDKTRIVRAFEVFRKTGVALSEHQRLSKLSPSPFDACVIGLNFSQRDLLYSRIDKRVDLMFENGLIEEAKEMFSKQLSGTASQAIAYKELFPYYRNEKDLEECKEFLKMQSRRYAKRQLTWFRHDKKINWINVDCEKDVLSKAKEIIKTSDIWKEAF